MECSTPFNNKGNSLRRRTLMKSVAATPINTESFVDDENERSSRRSLIEIQRKNQESSNSTLNESFRFTGEQEIKDHLKICTKLYAENKITIGVAWQLKIIDLLKVVSRNKNTDSLQVAGTSLDIGAKVYGLRVDDVHADALKLANSMARFAEKEQVQDQDDNVDDGKNETAQVVNKKKKTFRLDKGVKSTITKDRQSLLAPIPQLESVLFSNRIDSHLSTVDNLFTNTLPMDKKCSKLLAMSDEIAWITGTDETVQSLQDQKDLDIDLLPTSSHICTPFQNFIIDQWNIDEEEQTNNDALINDVVVFDDDGIPLHELDGSINNNDLINDEEIETQPEEHLARQMQQEVVRTVDILQTASTGQRSEYSYNGLITLSNGKVVDQIWAGPSHWKVKFVCRDKARYSGAVDAQKVAKKKNLKKNEPQPVNLDDNEDVEEMLNKLKKLKFKKKIHPANKVTLPLPDSSCQDMMRNIDELMIKPGFTVTQVRNDPMAGIENGGENFMNNSGNNGDNVDNDNLPDHMDYLDNATQEEIDRDAAGFREQNFMGENLVDAPEYAAKMYVPYASQAKKMDMKKLKNSIWQMLAPNQEKMVESTTFSKIFAEAKDTLPTAMAKELSCSLAFSAILHLCNENNLKLTPLEGSKNFSIESDRALST